MKLLLPLIAAALLALAGCATSTDHAARDSRPTATCHVCRYNNDLACVCVNVKDSTPQTDYLAATYYFCSEECRAAFVKRPEKYLPKNGVR
jgi:YHS domain-containing protein